MISKFFDLITRISLRFRWVTVGISVLVLALGVWAMTQLNMELLPRIEFPQTVVIVQWPDAESVDQFLEEVTLPLEDALGPEAIEGVVNVETTTSAGFAVAIVRNDFGLNQDTILSNIKEAVDGAGLPETAVPQVLNFSLSDLPVVIASISSADLTLPELKELVQSDLQPQLEGVERVSQVSVSGGQELPEDGAEDTVVAAASTEEPTPEPTPTVDPNLLPLVVTQGAKAFDLDIKYVSDVTPELLAGLQGSEEDILYVLSLIPSESLPYAPKETIALLPIEFIETLDPAMVAQLNELAAEAGGTGQFTIAQTVKILDGADPVEVAAQATVAALPTAVPTPETTPEPIAEPIAEAPELPEFAPVPLPDTWIVGAAQMGQTITDTSDITVEVMGAIMNFAPQQLAELTPEMWRALSPEVVASALKTAVALPELADTFTPELLAQLQAIQQAAQGQNPEPAPLPGAWVTQAAYVGLTISTTADITPDFMGLMVDNAPEMLDTLTPEILLAFTPDVLAALPPEYVAALDPGLQQTIANTAVAAARFAASQVATGNTTSETGDKAAARLPDPLIQGAQMAGLTIEYAQDITPEMMRLFAGLGPQGIQALGLLTPDNLRLLQPEVIALLPAEFVDTLPADLRGELDELAAEFGGAGALAIAESAAADPAALPAAIVQGAQMAGFTVETAGDITPDMIRLFGGLGEQGLQVLALLTPDNLRMLQPEVIALLPAEFIDTLPADLRGELDELAAEFGGASALAIAEAEAAAALSEGAPALSGIWVEPAPDGTASMFQTAADILNNAFVPGAANFLNFFPTAPNVENPADWMGALTPDVVAFLAENEAEFVTTLSPVVLEMMSPETLTYLLDNYPDAFPADLTERLRGIASGAVTVFVPEASITRTDGNPSVLVSIYKDGDANTVEVAHAIFDLLAAYEESHPDVKTNLVFEQATFIEDSVTGVSREGALGAGFAILVILLFLSGHVGGKYKLSWRATLVSGVSIPLSVFAAFLFMHLVPVIGNWMQGLMDAGSDGVLTYLARLFPTNVTLNIMTLSGLTVAIGRVVDDSIVVLENSYRYIQRGLDPKQAVLAGTKEVAIAIFSATVTTVAVFLPLGLIGGLIGSFFLPFGLTVTYALAASFIVSITVVPALTYLLIRKEHIPEEKETTMQRWYTPVLKWALTHRFVTMLIATLIFLGSLLMLEQLPQSFIPSIGDPTINVTVNLPGGTMMADTNALVAEMETAVADLPNIETVQSEIGSAGGVEAFFGGSGVSQNVANMTISVTDQEQLANLTLQVRGAAEAVFGAENAVVSAASQTGFGGFSLIITGDNLDELRAMSEDVKTALSAMDEDGDGVPDIVNVTSNVDNGGVGGSDTVIRIDGRPAISFSADLETDNTLGVTASAKAAITALPNLPAGVEISEGFESEQQVEGFRSMVTAIGYSIIIVYLIMALTFRSLVHPFTILFSLPFALVGAALALF
ncbi:MAG: efflux RND transporter permease subunit, partial [Ardenticatenaceae bacterium]|nr:efflux RND transporter permease subunit [Ardenticatenaceae bacterium]